MGDKPAPPSPPDRYFDIRLSNLSQNTRLSASYSSLTIRAYRNRSSMKADWMPTFLSPVFLVPIAGSLRHIHTCVVSSRQRNKNVFLSPILLPALFRSLRLRSVPNLKCNPFDQALSFPAERVNSFFPQLFPVFCFDRKDG